MKAFVTASTRGAQAIAGVVCIVALVLGCGGGRSDFIGGRVKDACDASWPVCSEVAGCILGDESYAEGRFPGEGRFIVQVPEASTVRVSLYLEDVLAAGEETVVTVHEEGCRARTRQAVAGRTVAESMEKFGEFVREVEVTGVGDHLVEFSSDMQARYVLKVEVTSKRNP
jgi:hypothetical protein